MKDKYILDSSIWIELERKNKKISDLVLPLILQNEVALIDLIAAEVLRGCRTEKDYQMLSNAFNVFPSYSTSWTEVGKLGFKVSKKGFQPPLSDLYIAQCIIEHNKTLISQDKHFKHIQSIKHFELILL